jgi:hypothetical protein
MVLHLVLLLYFLPPLPLTYFVVLFIVAASVVAFHLLLEWSSYVLVLDPNSSVVFHIHDLLPWVSMVLHLAPLPFESSHWALLHYPHLGPMPLCLLGFHIQNLGRFLLISLQLVFILSFIGFILGQFFFKLLRKIFFCNFPPFLKLCIIIFHFAFSFHEGIIL